MADDAEDNPVEIELESLEAIYINELSYNRKADGSLDTIELLLHPATGGNKDEQFVCMTLVFTPSPKYPHEIPAIEIKNPRGLGEEEVASLVEDMITKAHECVGEVMMFTLIEMAKDSLTEGNIPHCPCVVCLEHFQEQDLFHRTVCYHYFHNKCLARYLEHSRRQIEELKEDEQEIRHREPSEENKVEAIGCPLCRNPLSEESLAFTTDGNEGDQRDEQAADLKFELSSDLKEQQAKMAELFARQKAKGGIIDLQQEKNKYLVNAEESRPVTSTSSSQLSLPASKGEDLKNSYLHTVDSRQGKGERNEKSRGRGRGQHNHPRERNDSGHNHHHHHHHRYNPRTHNHGHHHHHQEARHGSGRGRPNRGGSAIRGSHHGDKGFVGGQRQDKVGQENALSPREEPEAKAIDSDQVREESSSDRDNRICSLQNSEWFEETESTYERTGPDSKLQDRKGSASSYGRQRNLGGNRRGRRGFYDNPRERGGNHSCKRNNPQEDQESVRGSDKLEGRTEALRGDSDEGIILSEPGQGRIRGQRANLKGRGRGRFRDIDRAYFEGKATASDDPNHCDKPSKVLRDSTTRGRRGGCRDRHIQNFHRDEYDDSDSSNPRYSKGPPNSGRSYYKSGSIGQRSQDAGSNNHNQSQENYRGESQSQSNNFNKCDTGQNPDFDLRTQQELEMNRKWRKLNFGYNGSETDHKRNMGFKVIDDDESDDDQRGYQEPKVKVHIDSNSVTNANMFIPSGSDKNLNMYYVGYNEEEEEEDWEKESFPYTFERSYIRTEHLKEYDKFRRKDYEFYRKKVQDRADRERLMREEDRRMRREQAERERKLADSAEPKPPTKSVLELFQEKQEAKRKEAERLKQEQQRQESGHEIYKTESLSDEAFHSDDHLSSSGTSRTGSIASVLSSSQGYYSQSSTEELPQEVACCHTTSAKSEPQSATKDKSGAYGQTSTEIKWVGVKQQPHVDVNDLTKDEENECIRPGLDDPCVDAWQRREELKRNGKARRKKNNKKGEKSSVSDAGVPKVENNRTDDSLVLSSSTETNKSTKDDTLEINYPSSKCPAPSKELTQTAIANKEDSKQKILTKAPPLDLSKRKKCKPPSAPTAHQPCSSLPELTKKELDQLKALYIDEVSTKVESKSQLYEAREQNPYSTQVSSNILADQGEEGAVEIEGLQKDAGALVADFAISSCLKATSNYEEPKGVQKENKIRLPLNKPFKKAPPLNLKQISKKKFKPSEANELAIASEGENVSGKTGQKNMAKVMNYLGIQLDDDNN